MVLAQIFRLSTMVVYHWWNSIEIYLNRQLFHTVVVFYLQQLKNFMMQVLQSIFLLEKHLNHYLKGSGGPNYEAILPNFANNVQFVHLKGTAFNMLLVQRLPIPFEQSHSYTLGFITNLPPAHGSNCVLIVINPLMKFIFLIPCIIREKKLSTA